MRPVKRTLISLRTGGHNLDLSISYLDKRSFRIYRTRHENRKSAFYRPVRWEYTIELGNRALSLYYKRDL